MRLLYFIFPLISCGLFAQQPYFQQRVDYSIEVELFDSLHQLQGYIAMEYYNHSADTLHEIYFHLWPNAYRSKETAYAKQELIQGSRNFYFAPPDQMGRIYNLDFRAAGKTATLEEDPHHPDVGRLILPDALPPGHSLQITTPFTVQIPGSFSRLGHVGPSYQITQWYPKPAVYDKKGWHPMPYLDQGEFYSEFGSFDVRITLPSNYVVGATGTLQTPEEQRFLEEKVRWSSELLEQDLQAAGDTFPPSSTDKKTIRFTADQVHDFAWFADKRFYVQKGSAHLPSGKNVETWVMFTDVNRTYWKSAIQYVNRSVEFYSRRVGEYPYPQATAIQSALSAGGGMEYPMITVIGEVSSAYELDIVITHEVGHNWFYGILASNERDHAWMDEGLNSYYEQAYSATYYPEREELPLPGFLTRQMGALHLNELLYLFQSRLHRRQPCNTPSAELTAINYGLCAYLQPAWNLQYLEAYLGADVLDRAMQTYYDQWKFRHPYPEDLRLVLETSTGKALSWLFDDLFGSTKEIDYAIVAARKGPSDGVHEVTIRNKGQILAPLCLASVNGDSLSAITWIEPFTGLKAFEMASAQSYILDPMHRMVTARRANDRFSTGGLFRKTTPLALRLLPGIDRPGRTNLYWLPLVAYNRYDGLMAGAILYNGIFPFKAFDFYALPLFSSQTGEAAGTAHLRKQLYFERGLISRLAIEADFRTFHFEEIEQEKRLLRYWRWEPEVKLYLRKKPLSTHEHSLSYRLIGLSEQAPVYSDTGSFLSLNRELSWIHEGRYQWENRAALSPFDLTIAVEHQAYRGLNGEKSAYLKGTITWDGRWYYAPRRSFYLRFFGGAFLQNSGRDAGNVLTAYRSRGSLGLASQGFNDYRYDEYFFGRNTSSGWASQQVGYGEGGMKFNFGSPFANTSGFSNDYLLAVNLKADLPKDLPLRLPLKPYLDAGYFHNAQPTGADDTFSDQFFWNAGVMLGFGQVAGIYFPIVSSANLERLYAEKAVGNYFKRITFSLNLSGFQPGDILTKISF